MMADSIQPQSEIDMKTETDNNWEYWLIQLGERYFQWALSEGYTHEDAWRYASKKVKQTRDKYEKEVA
tara:strand:+ start:821 stop:1024 length:204 start_codon:yes stop_codon:yes gene_type:complete